MSDLEVSKTSNPPEVPSAGEIDEYDPEQMLRQFYINCDALALYNKLESLEFDVSEVLQVCASARHPEIYRNIIKKISVINTLKGATTFGNNILPHANDVKIYLKAIFMYIVNIRGMLFSNSFYFSL